MKLQINSPIVKQFSSDGRRFSFAPAEGERAGVRGLNWRLQSDRRQTSPHPDPLPFGRGEGTKSLAANFDLH